MKHLFLAALLVASIFPSAFASDFIPEASAACRVNGTMYVASDEVSGAFWAKRNDVLTKVKVSGARWDDMEGLAAAEGNLIFAATSQGLTKKGKRKEERELLFLLSSGDKITVKKSWALRDQILKALGSRLESSLDMERVRTAVPDEGGLNVEGLAYLEGKLYLGLRSPLTKKGEAIIVELGQVMTEPVIENVLTVSLAGNGIRGLETRGGEILILSGTTNDADTAFSLYKFHPGTRKLGRLNVPGFDELARPESLVHDGDGIHFVQDFQDERDDVIVRLGY